MKKETKPFSKEDYDNIASCVRRRGTISQRDAFKRMQNTQGWDSTHDGKIGIAILEKELSQLREENFFLKRGIVL
jgi:hypothetical protein